MDNAQQLENRHHFQVYNRYPVTLDHGLGAKVWDTNGDEYIDVLGGIAGIVTLKLWMQLNPNPRNCFMFLTSIIPKPKAISWSV